jgi:hypothetical protein
MQLLVRILFVPFSLAGGLLAGLIGKKLFDFVWARIDDQEPPEAEHREASWGRVVTANAIQGAIFRAARAVADREARMAFSRATGVWPGEEKPDAARL